MSARLTTIAGLRDLPVWTDIVVLLDKVIGAHDNRMELEVLLTLLVLQAQERAQKRAHEQMVAMLDRLTGTVDQIAKAAPANQSDTKTAATAITDRDTAQG